MSTLQRIPVMVADDHPLFRLGLRELLRGDAGLELVAEASDVQQAIEKACQFKPMVALVDMLLPPSNGIDAAEQIKREVTETNILMIGLPDHEHELFGALDAGAIGFLVATNEPEEILYAIRDAAEGNAYLPSDVAKRVLDRFLDCYDGGLRSDSRKDRITPRETAILRVVAQGKHNREIALELGISERTVGNHLAKIYSKLNLKARSQAILYAVRHGIVQI